MSLFPRRETDLVSRCACPDWSIFCKHAAAVHYVLACMLASDPFLLLELRGRSRQDLKKALRRARGERKPLVDKQKRKPKGKGGARKAPRESESAASRKSRDEASYERPIGDYSDLHFRIEPPSEHGSILRPLGQPPSWSRREDVESWLKPTYEAASNLARDVALGSPSGPESVAAAAKKPRKKH